MTTAVAALAGKGGPALHLPAGMHAALSVQLWHSHAQPSTVVQKQTRTASGGAVSQQGYAAAQRARGTPGCTAELQPTATDRAVANAAAASAAEGTRPSRTRQLKATGSA